MKKTTVRVARADELKTVQDLNYKLFVSDQKHFGNLNLDWPYNDDGRKYFEGLISGKKGVVFVAEQNGRVIGYLAGSIAKPNSAYQGRWAEIENMFVEDSERSKGVGAKLVDVFYGWCKDKDVNHVIVSAFSPNTRAIAFYEKQGLEPYSLTLKKTL